MSLHTTLAALRNMLIFQGKSGVRDELGRGIIQEHRLG